jgi:hypothetical protein
LSRIISAPYLAPDIQPYISPGTGRVVNSRSQMAADLQRSGCIMHEPGLEKDIARWKVQHREKAFAPVASAVDETVKALVNTGKIES